ncbi:MAG: hypothetical protein E7304_12760 [Butyrivibrio sp.]|jgi:oligoribonuclease (3'-5' exoribonuclease)|uniref:hypothetical protein n=1 Tax=Butyrivibrio sp. TaxID=28121 RepID=UPI001EBF74EF|nr:hypothetical protein [Butyrivibrio sp.]MBE5842260.1 hypothetical protein [Butyrivibrio sp.]
MEENRTENEQPVVSETSVSSETALLTQMRDLHKKQLFWQKISTCCIAVMAATVVIVAIAVVPKTVSTIHNVNQVAIKAQTSLEDMDEMISNITEASSGMNELVKENGEGLTSAVKNLSEIDFEGLNTAIKDLQDAIGPMAQFMNKFK